MSDPFTNFSDADRRTLVLASEYERLRRKCVNGYSGYHVFGCGFEELTTDVCKNPNFKALTTVRKWLEKEGLTVSLDEIPWRAYLKYLFSTIEPNAPQPGQLKNKIVLREYLAGGSETGELIEPARTGQELERIYKKVLPSWISDNHGMMRALGLTDLDRLDNDK